MTMQRYALRRNTSDRKCSTASSAFVNRRARSSS